MYSLYVLRRARPADVYKLQPRDEIRNIPKTSECTARGASSFKGLMEKKTKVKNTKCQKFRCMKTNTVGAHVEVKGEKGKVFISRLCATHNSATNKEWMRVTSGAMLAKVTKRDTKGGKQCSSKPTKRR